MFDIGFWEIMLISILAMVVIGPERLPGLARTVGHWFGKTRRFIEGVKGEVESEFDTTELKRLLHNQEVQLKELQSKVNNEAGDIRSGFSYNMDDDGSSKDDDDIDIEDDYLEFMDEDEEKDHEQIAAEKKRKQEAMEDEHRQATAKVQQERRDARALEDSATETSATEVSESEKTDTDNLVASETDKKSQNDG